jgi:hypothetical protein
MKNLLEPWVLLPIVASFAAALFFVRAAATGVLVLRRFDARRATEGQLLLERRLELASTTVRVATVISVLGLALFVYAADRLHFGVRGAMCAYGVLHENEWGIPALYAAIALALTAGVASQLFALDARVPGGMELARPLAALSVFLAPLSLAAFALLWQYASTLDLTVVASCCSTQIDETVAQGGSYASGPRVLATESACIAIAAAVAVAFFVSRRPTRARMVLAAATSVMALPLAVAASVLEVAPYVFETPRHTCPFCLLRSDALGIGFPLFGAIYLAFVWCAGAGLGALLARTEASRGALAEFARARLSRGAVAWAVALVVGITPIIRYALITGGASLFR